MSSALQIKMNLSSPLCLKTWILRIGSVFPELSAKISCVQMNLLECCGDKMDGLVFLKWI